MIPFFPQHTVPVVDVHGVQVQHAEADAARRVVLPPGGERHRPGVRAGWPRPLP